MFHQQVFTRFAQQRGEPFYAAWDRFNDLADNFRYHDFSNYSLLKFFLNGLDAVIRRWVFDGALAAGSQLFCRDDDEVMHLFNDMAEFDYHRYWDLLPQCWSPQYVQEDHYPDFIDQPFELQKDEGDSHESIMTQLEDIVNKFVASTEAAIEIQNNCLCQLEEQIENIMKSTFHDRRECESDVEETENIEMLEPLLVCEPQPEEIFEEFSDKYVPTLFFSPYAYYSEPCVVEVTSLQCLYLAKLEGAWNQDPYVVSYDTNFGRQPLFDEGF